MTTRVGINGFGRIGRQVLRATMERHPGEPFFILIHSYAAAWPYVPPRGYTDLFSDGRLERPGRLDEGGLVRYEREVRHLDDHLRGFIERLDRLSDPARTLVVVTRLVRISSRRMRRVTQAQGWR